MIHSGRAGVPQNIISRGRERVKSEEKGIINGFETRQECLQNKQKWEALKNFQVMGKASILQRFAALNHFMRASPSAEKNGKWN